MTQYHQFDQDQIDAAIAAARSHYDQTSIMTEGAPAPAHDDGHMAMAAGCISVAVEDHKICINLPLGLGDVCIPIPSFIPDGTLAEACLHICTTFGIPTGVKVTISVAGKTIVSKSFGKC